LTATEGGTTTYYIYDGGLCINEGTTSSDKDLINGVGLGGGIGGVLYQVQSGQRKHFVYNQVGHTVVETSSAGAVTAWHRYEAFGNRFAAAGTSASKRLANTKEMDSSTGLYNHGFRYYDPGIGRYIARDPLGYTAGWNVYSYVHNNPVARIDATGLWEESAMLEKYFEKYGEKGYKLYQTMVADGYSFAKRDYWFDDWAVEDDNKVIGVASSWWAGVDDSDETAADQFHQALSDTYDSTVSKLTNFADVYSPFTGVVLRGSDQEQEALGIDPKRAREARAFEASFKRQLSAMEGDGKTAAVSAIVAVGAAKTVDKALDALRAYRAAAKGIPDELPVLRISSSKYPDLAENVLHAQKAGHPDVLTHGGDAVTKANRSAALKDVPQISGLSRDEYPFASSLQGGGGSWVGHIPASQQNAQGALIKNFIKQNNIQPGSQYRVIVEP
jgi:RHS repeat-associated protein